MDVSFRQLVKRIQDNVFDVVAVVPGLEVRVVRVQTDTVAELDCAIHQDHSAQWLRVCLFGQHELKGL